MEEDSRRWDRIVQCPHKMKGSKKKSSSLFLFGYLKCNRIPDIPSFGNISSW